MHKYKCNWIFVHDTFWLYDVITAIHFMPQICLVRRTLQIIIQIQALQIYNILNCCIVQYLLLDKAGEEGISSTVFGQASRPIRFIDAACL